MERMNRRTFIATAGASVALIASCKDSSGASSDGSEHLTARVTPPTTSLSPGLHSLGISTGRDGLLYVPTGYDPATPLPLVVLLHGAGGTASNWFGSYGDRANANKFVMLAPDSRAASWDVRFGSFGPDVAFINAALLRTFAACAINPQQIALAGFSDGASYALSLGVANGDLFSQLIAYSPGFLTDSTPRGKPQVFESHGIQDTVLPIDVASRPIVAKLRSRGYSVDYQEFTGGHEVPRGISDAAMSWLQAKYHSA